MSHGQGDLQAVFDWRQTGPQTWDIEVETEAGLTLKLTHGGSCLEIGGRVVVKEDPAEYQAIYRRFDELLNARQSEVDDRPVPPRGGRLHDRQAGAGGRVRG